MKPRVTLSGLHLQSLGGVRVNGQYRSVPAVPDDRAGKGYTVLQLARQTPKGPAASLVKFADGHQQVVPWASLRSLREKYPLTPLDLGA